MIGPVGMNPRDMPAPGPVTSHRSAQARNGLIAEGATLRVWFPKSIRVRVGHLAWPGRDRPWMLSIIHGHYLFVWLADSQPTMFFFVELIE